MAIASPLRDTYERRESKVGTTGLFATGPIPKYSEILCESPLLVVPDTFSNTVESAELKRIFARNPLNRRLLASGCKAIELFAACHILLQSKTDKRTRAVLEKLSVGPLFRIGDCEKPFVPVIAGITKCAETLVQSTIGKMRTNAFSITGSLVKSSLGLAIYEDAMSIRHSCDPNSLPYFRVDGTVTFLATKDIAEGEEITFSYAVVLPHGVEERRRFIAEHFYFTCTCARCIEEEKISPQTSDDVFTAQKEDSAFDAKLDRLVGAVEQRVNQLLAKWTDVQVGINKDDVFGAQNTSRMFVDLCGKVPFTHPKAFPATRILLSVICLANRICVNLKLIQLKADLFWMAFSTLLRVNELEHLPPEVWKGLLNESLLFAALGGRKYPDSYGWLVENLIQSTAVDLRTVMVVQAFAPMLLGRRLSFLWAISPKLREARAHCPAAFFDVDKTCAPGLPAILDGNSLELAELLARQQPTEEAS